MFCKNCGSPVDEGTKFCPSCGARIDSVPVSGQGTTSAACSRQQNSALKLTPALSWLILGICALLLIVALSMALDANRDHDYLRSSDLVGPIICSILSLGASTFVMLNAKKERASDPKFKTVYFIGIIILILSVIMAIEVCIGPAIGEATRKK